MRRQLRLELELWDDSRHAALWDGFPGPACERVVDLYTRLALRAARSAEPPDAGDTARPEDELHGRKADERGTGSDPR